MGSETLLITVTLMAIVTYVPRAVPVVYMAETRFSNYLERWLSYVPLALLSTVVACQLLMHGPRLDLSLSNEYLVPGAVAVAVAVRSRNLCLTIILGIAALALRRHF